MNIPKLPGGILTEAGLGVAVAALGYLMVRKAAGDTRSAGSILGEAVGKGAAAAVGGAAVGAVKGTGAVLGIPDTNEAACAAAKAAGSTWEASKYCDAADFLKWSYGRVTGSATSSAPANEQQKPTLRRGDSGALVRELQKKLGVTVDGIFGPATEAAVRDYQRRIGLKDDGIVGMYTWAALENGAVPALNQSGTLTDSKYRDLVR
jgi:peptidoglycan hydrolase-like protein with peptidoglycan-binding domain